MSEQSVEIDALEAAAYKAGWADCLAECRDEDLLNELDRLRRWKAEAMEVMDGLQEVGHALGIPLGTRITGRAAVDAALDLRNSPGSPS